MVLLFKYIHICIYIFDVYCLVSQYLSFFVDIVFNTQENNGSYIFVSVKIHIITVLVIQC